MLYRISVAERGLTGIANIFRSRLSGLDDLLRAGTVPLKKCECFGTDETIMLPLGSWRQSCKFHILCLLEKDLPDFPVRWWWQNYAPGRSWTDAKLPY